MRRLDGGAGRRRGRRTGPQLRQPAPGNSGPRAGAAPALPARNRHPGGVGAPPGGTTAPCQELADRRRIMRAAKARPDAGRRTPQQSAERRAGPRHGPVIFGDPEIGPLARRTTGCGVPHQRLSALCSPHFSGSGNRRRGPAASQPGRRSVGCSTIKVETDASAIRRVERDVLRDLALPAVAVREQALLVVVEFLARLGREFEVRSLDDGIDRAGFLAQPAIDALHHVDVVAGGAARAVVAARAGFDGDRLRRADRLAQLAGDAALLPVGVAAEACSPRKRGEIGPFSNG